LAEDYVTALGRLVPVLVLVLVLVLTSTQQF
jgi:hypothetical protein